MSHLLSQIFLIERFILTTESGTEFQRRSIRDIEQRGRDIESLRQLHHERRIQYELFMHPYCEHFDVVIKIVNAAAQIERNLSNDKYEQREKSIKTETDIKRLIEEDAMSKLPETAATLGITVGYDA